MRTKTFTILLVAALLMLSGAGQADELRIDGSWWNAKTKSQKIVYILGFVDGLVYTQKLFGTALMLAGADPQTDKWSPDRALITEQAGKIANNQIHRDFSNTTAGQLMEGLDKIYSDYRNTGIQVQEAIIVVVRSIDGTSDDDIVKLLERKRHDTSK